MPLQQIEEEKYKRLISIKRRQFYVFLSIFTLICTLLAFCTPYWLQSWPRVHTEFKRLGLWEFCMNGFMAPQDMQMQSFFGCWWILAPYYDRVKDILNPPWFIAVQVIYSLTFILQVVLNILLLFYGCKIVKNIERRALLSKVLFIGQLISVILTFIAVVVFGCRCFDTYWMPRPELNWPSWSYGLAVLSCFGMVYCCGVVWFIMREDKRILNQEQYNFPTHAHSSVVRNKAPAASIVRSAAQDDSSLI